MSIEPATLALLILTTFLIGIILGFIGAGGAGVLLGLLAGVFDLPIGTAIGTALAAMCVVTISGAISHYREGNVALRIGLVTGCAGIIGALIGATLSQDVSETTLRWASGLALWSLAFLVWLRTRLMSAPADIMQDAPSPLSFRQEVAASIGLGSTGGIAAGFLGVGMAPYLQLGLLSVHRLSLRKTVGTTMWALVFISASAATVLATHGDVSGPYLVGSVVGLSAGTFMGAKLTRRVPVRVLRVAIVAVPVIAGSMVIFL
ncbi:MAG: sulfite exporter TauE/SafE family protein [Thermomicrobiales bacterium]